ncbi:unnamed protein product [Trichobilharzia regenti]|uniref:J domain-containing protein n=1 Tax=Trichobilharzia regenti TaxID=157069 RepID=A0A183VZN1_TRIRE|nr:unnamed protein product [Trichobilharzia regenti]VDQ01817.1 unnamed protein product [Trichobilharzia regenti]
MSSLLKDCNKYFHTKNLYEVLEVAKGCSKPELRKAFYKLSLVHHPDRHENDSKSEATQKFQVLSRIYAYLDDDEKRKIYDETGVIDEEDEISGKSYDDWMNYWRLLFPKITPTQIDEYRQKYVGSEEETEQLIKVYNSSKGDMDTIMETLILTSYEDEPRIRSLIDKLISEQRIKAFKNYTHEPPEKAAKRAKRALNEKKLFEKQQKKNNSKKLKKSNDDDDGGLDSLAKAIQSRHANALQSSENFLDKIAEKYASMASSSAKKRTRKTTTTAAKKKK